MQLRQNQLARPNVKVVTNTTFTVPDNYSFATFVNVGAADGSIDFGNGQVMPISNKESLTMPYVGNSYSETKVDATGTIIKVIWLP